MYFLKCKKIKKVKSRVVKAKNGRIMVLSNCVTCGSKKSKFIKEQEASKLLSSLGIRKLLIQIPLVGPLLF